jgi:hypothetical protein
MIVAHKYRKRRGRATARQIVMFDRNRKKETTTMKLPTYLNDGGNCEQAFVSTKSIWAERSR